MAEYNSEDMREIKHRPSYFERLKCFLLKHLAFSLKDDF